VGAGGVKGLGACPALIKAQEKGTSVIGRRDHRPRKSRTVKNHSPAFPFYARPPSKHLTVLLIRSDVRSGVPLYQSIAIAVSVLARSAGSRLEGHHIMCPLINSWEHNGVSLPHHLAIRSTLLGSSSNDLYSCTSV